MFGFIKNAIGSIGEAFDKIDDVVPQLSVVTDIVNNISNKLDSVEKEFLESEEGIIITRLAIAVNQPTNDIDEKHLVQFASDMQLPSFVSGIISELVSSAGSIGDMIKDEDEHELTNIEVMAMLVSYAQRTENEMDDVAIEKIAKDILSDEEYDMLYDENGEARK